MGESGGLTLARDESLLWSGESPPRSRRRIVLVFLVVLAFYGATIVIGGVVLDQWEHLPAVLLAATGASLGRVVFVRRTLTNGRYTVTTHRVVVQNSWLGIHCQREERLTDLVPPKLVEVRGIAAVRFGDFPDRLAGHRGSGAIVFPLVLHPVSGAAEAFEAIRHAQSR